MDEGIDLLSKPYSRDTLARKVAITGAIFLRKPYDERTLKVATEAALKTI